MKKFNQMTEKQMSKVNGGFIFPLVFLVFAGTLGSMSLALGFGTRNN